MYVIHSAGQTGGTAAKHTLISLHNRKKERGRKHKVRLIAGFVWKRGVQNKDLVMGSVSIIQTAPGQPQYIFVNLIDSTTTYPNFSFINDKLDDLI